jgi:hypothetical protein
MSFRKTADLRTFCRLMPAASTIALRFSNTLTAWISIPSPAMTPVFGSRAIMPDTNSRSPYLTACE